MLNVFTLVSVETDCIESVLRPAERFSDQLSSIVSAHDTDLFLNATARLHAESFADGRQTSLRIPCP